MNRLSKSGIEWLRNPDGSQGYAWNPITGCLNHRDGICLGGGFPCYAYRLANTRLRERYLANKNTATDNYDEDSYPFYPRFWPERLDAIKPPREYAEYSGAVRNALILQQTKGIFVCDMSDLFGIGIPESWTNAVIETIKVCPEHRFYLLTKQPQNLAKFSPFPDNCWVGVSATDEHSYVQRAMPLIGVDALVKYISFEPLLGPVDKLLLRNTLPAVDWVIIGAQTKPFRPPRVEWVKEIVEAADETDTPVFLKNNMMPLFKPLMRVPNMAWWGNVFGLRQELPKNVEAEVRR